MFRQTKRLINEPVQADSSPHLWRRYYQRQYEMLTPVHYTTDLGSYLGHREQILEHVCDSLPEMCCEFVENEVRVHLTDSASVRNVMS